MKRIYSALVLDDDPDSIAFMKWFMDENFPWVRVATGTEAIPAKGFDIYYIDNNFHGKARAVQIVREIRETDDNAMIIAYSATMDSATYKSLMNAGCNGAVEKGNSKDMAVMGRMTREYIQKRNAMDEADKPQGLRAVVQSMAELINQWNQAVSQPDSMEGVADESRV